MKKIAILFFVLVIIFTGHVFSQGNWVRMADYPGGARTEFIGYSLNGKGYIGTGTHGGINSFLSDWIEFDPAQNIWTYKAPLPMPFKGGVGFAAANYGYATCGANDATFIFDTYEYNQLGNNWSAKAQFVNTRLYSTAIGAGNKGYIVGGYDMMALPMTDCWEYDQPSNNWTQKASLPDSAARYYATGFSVNGKIYVFGGTGLNILNDLWEFDPATNNWTRKTSLPASARWQAHIFVIGNTAYLTGGFSPAGGSLKDCWKYDAANDQWTSMADFPGSTGIAGGVSFTVNGKGYVVCGNGTAECWEFTPLTTTVGEFNNGDKLVVFPNPASDKITLYCSNNTDIVYVAIYTSAGKIVSNHVLVNPVDKSLDISRLLPGAYFLVCKTSAGFNLHSSFLKVQ